VASADGELHPQERAIIQEFHAGGHDKASDLGSLARGGALEPQTLAAILGGPEAQRLFLKTAFLCAWADGRCSAEEAKTIEAYAKACGVDAAQLAELEATVKEYLLAQLAHLQNVDAAVEVKRELKL